MAHFFVAIAYEKGVISCEQHFGTLTGESFAEHVRHYFPAIFENSSNPCWKLFLQDGDPIRFQWLHIMLWMMLGAECLSYLPASGISFQWKTPGNKAIIIGCY